MTSPIAQLIAELRELPKQGAYLYGRLMDMYADPHIDDLTFSAAKHIARLEASMLRAAEALADYQVLRDERDTLASNYANLLADTSGEIAGLREALARQEELLAEAGKVLAVIAEGSVPPEQAGHYIAHRRCVTAAREAVRMLHAKAKEPA